MRAKQLYIKFIASAVLLSILLSLTTIASGVEVSSKVALLVNPETQDVLFEKNADEKVSPAGLATIMTAILAFEMGDMNDLVTVLPEDLLNRDLSSTARLKANEALPLSDLMYYMMLPSTSEAANAIARHIGGSVDAFVALMNSKAAELGCKNTNFTNPAGAYDKNQYTTANDMYKITLHAMKIPAFMDLVNTAAKKIPSTNLSGESTIFSNNYLISRYTVANYYYSAARGIKAGYTAEEGYCLVSSAQKGSNNLICFIFGAQRSPSNVILSYSETVRLYEWGFNNFTKKILLKKSEPITEVSVSLSKTNDYLILVPAGDLEKIVERDLPIDKLERKFTVNDDIKAPVKAGDPLGKVSVLYDGKVLATTDLVALTDVEKSEYLTLLDALVNTLNSFWFKLIVSLVIILLFAYLYILITARRNYRSNNIKRPTKRRKKRSRTRKF